MSVCLRVCELRKWFAVGNDVVNLVQFASGAKPQMVTWRQDRHKIIDLPYIDKTKPSLKKQMKVSCIECLIDFYSDSLEWLRRGSILLYKPLKNSRIMNGKFPRIFAMKGFHVCKTWDIFPTLLRKWNLIKQIYSMARNSRASFGCDIFGLEYLGFHF